MVHTDVRGRKVQPTVMNVLLRSRGVHVRKCLEVLQSSFFCLALLGNERVSGVEGREKESWKKSRHFCLSVSVASFGSLSGCGCSKTEILIDRRRPVGFEFKMKMVRSTFVSVHPCAWIIRRSIVGESPLGSTHKFHVCGPMRGQVLNRDRSILRAIRSEKCLSGTGMKLNQHIVLQNRSIGMKVHLVKSCHQARRNLRVELSMKFVAQRCKVIFVEWFKFKACEQK